jgi:hypothetical protein
MRYPHKSLALLRHADVHALNQLLDRAPKERLNLALSSLFQTVSRAHFENTFVPLVSTKELCGNLVTLLCVLAPADLGLFIREAPCQNLAIVLTAPEDKLSAFMAGIHADRLASSVVPIMQGPPELISGKLVPLLYKTDHPERIAALVNFIEPSILLAILREIPLSRIDALINALEEDDVTPRGALIQLMGSLVTEPHLVNEKVIPVIQQAPVNKLMPFLKRVRPDLIIPLLRLNDVDSVVRLIEHTNVELVGTLSDIHIEHGVAVAAGALAKALSNPTAACVIAKAMDALGNGIQTVDVAKNEGKRARGAAAQDAYRLGDVTRGVTAKLLSGLTQAQGVQLAAVCCVGVVYSMGFGTRINRLVLRTFSHRRAHLVLCAIKAYAMIQLLLRSTRVLRCTAK